MSLPANRQEKLDPIMEALRKLSGIQSVQQDDFNSAGIYVVLFLAIPKDFKGKKPLRFESSLRTMRAGIARTFKQTKRDFEFCAVPVMTYFDHGTVMGERLRGPDGYDSDRIIVLAYV